MLHGKEGNEYEMVTLARKLSSTCSVISIRGRITDKGRFAFIPRAKGKKYIDEIKQLARDIHLFLDNASIKYSFYRNNVVAVGYSDGAGMAVTISFLFPVSLKGLILFRTFLPFRPENIPDMEGVRMLFITGKYDSISKPKDTEELIGMMSRFGAKINHFVIEAGHDLTREDIEIAREWLNRNFG
jgi:phospholipase/carboxylesterase